MVAQAPRSRDAFRLAKGRGEPIHADLPKLTMPDSYKSLTEKAWRAVLEGFARQCEIIEQNKRPSEVDPAYNFCSVSLNDRVERIGHVYATAHRDDLPARVLAAEALLDELLYVFRDTIGTYDKKLLGRVEDFLRAEWSAPK
jgi:hypothetical protein